LTLDNGKIWQSIEERRKSYQSLFTETK